MILWPVWLIVGGLVGIAVQDIWGFNIFLFAAIIDVAITGGQRGSLSTSLLPMLFLIFIGVCAVMAIGGYQP